MSSFLAPTGPSTSDQHFLGEKLGKKMVSIFVGPKRKEYILHKELICQSDYFCGAFKSSFSEARDGTMYLPEDNPAAFDLYVEFTYRKQIPAGNSESYLHNLYDLYVMADKFCDTKLKDIVMDTIQNLAKEHELLDVMFSRDQVLKVFSNTTDGSEGLSLFLTHIICYAFTSRMEQKRDGGGKGKLTSKYSTGDLELMWELGKEHKSVFMQIQEQMLANVRGPYNRAIADPRHRVEQDPQSRCLYHTHDKDFDCRQSASALLAGFLLDVTENPEVGSKKTCVDSPLIKYAETRGEQLYNIAQVYSEIEVLKGSQSKAWVLKHEPRDEVLQMYNEHSELVFELSVHAILVSICAGRKEMIVDAPSGGSQRLGSTICIKFHSAAKLLEFYANLTASYPSVEINKIVSSRSQDIFRATLPSSN